MSEIDSMHGPLSSLRPTGKRRRSIPLHTARDARRFLSKIINAAYRDELPHDKAGRLGYLVGIILKSIETAELEKRIETLESQTRVR